MAKLQFKKLFNSMVPFRPPRWSAEVRTKPASHKTAMVKLQQESTLFFSAFPSFQLYQVVAK
ncbi:Os04g0507950 [Oryza sativa Japonica Group]|uniref:Uncharacterized protein n=3 Tax=Oryza sativa TaxID=4530 RepID=A0A8J8XDW8_ORYSJ|nr:hypothetical protein OsI_16572 [Oryza sativa Indica Group]EEE61307.1 hypothetical protein OsJ_15401 [Oryza sativa Japonica Group]KAB8096032.1 hypothetical protein EE612_024307 [Oryza sativa]BAS90003.1 Os04g0507950 [Oryza sativa Japonica Group]